MNHHRERECTINIPLKKINGIDYSVSPILLQKSLIKVMSEQCGFKFRSVRLPDRYTTTYEDVDLKIIHDNPLGIYDRSTNTSWSTFEVEKDQLGSVILSEANQQLCANLERAYSILFCHHLGQKYPLIFSQGYVEKLTGTTKRIPTMARSLQRILETAKTASKTHFQQKALDYLQMTRQKNRILQSHHRQQQEGFGELEFNSIYGDLVMGLYHSTKNTESLRQHRVMIKGKPTLSIVSSSASRDRHEDSLQAPNADQAIQDLWATL
ncbi:uncharacterized protein BX664DRAFT_384921 [Halteromyces radiatus]|uniref:uncharacterized protein n=1 Tax=Halteromyces radiatus TaxID=101107 RepID=UPI00221F87AB|nr:uncharacterized protein BX664DRAFT_384921 [Halteromyces radiatus]KAI8093501.1 hypothetical protein BX664DRAFT_384921 [Halteromyces radiatus]